MKLAQPGWLRVEIECHSELLFCISTSLTKVSMQVFQKVATLQELSKPSASALGCRPWEFCVDHTFPTDNQVECVQLPRQQLSSRPHSTESNHRDDEGAACSFRNAVHHPHMPPFLHDMYLEMQAKRIGKRYWTWDTKSILQVYKVTPKCTCRPLSAPDPERAMSCHGHNWNHH